MQGSNMNDDSSIGLASAATPLMTDSAVSYASVSSSDNDDDLSEDSQSHIGTNSNSANKANENPEADILAQQLLACNGDEELEHLVMRRSLDISDHALHSARTATSKNGYGYFPLSKRSRKEDLTLFQRMVTIISIALIGLLVIFVLFQVSGIVVGPPSQPLGPYKLVQVQEGENFFDHYTFYDGPDSVGSNGYITYVSRQSATDLKIANIIWEDVQPVFDSDYKLERNEDGTLGGRRTDEEDRSGKGEGQEKGGKEPFVYMNTAPTHDGPRHSVRLEGLKRFNRGLFIIDLRHMPAGCGSWPAFWMTDEPNWPINGEIDIVEGVNTQSVVKTAMHTTKGCSMNDVPMGVNTGYWDTAVGVPKKNGDIDHTEREAKDCFVYSPHQWLNQGCVAISDQEGSLGVPLNEKGGGVFVLEWDPANRYIKSWVFAPHSKVPENLQESLQSANDKESTNKVSPEPTTWGLPYAHFPIGSGTACAASHFSNMHLIFNTAICGTVAGNRFFMDCPHLKEKYGTCENYVKADTPEMKEMYWKIRGVYVYEREWEKEWLD